jgi:hypothetical protein
MAGSAHLRTHILGRCGWRRRYIASRANPYRRLVRSIKSEEEEDEAEERVCQQHYAVDPTHVQRGNATVVVPSLHPPWHDYELFFLVVPIGSDLRTP